MPKKRSALPQKFADLGLETPVLKALAKVGFTEPSDIQRELIPVVLAGKDAFGQARTGTGKTAAFALPILQFIDPDGPMQALIVAPTRELAAQIVGEIRRLAEFIPIHCVPVYGGTSMAGQIQQLGKKPHIIVGTPGRIIDMLNRGAFNLDGVRWAILDEVDRMLDIGFRDDIKKILSRIRHKHQTVFVSATLEDEITKLARQYMTDPVEVNVSRDTLTVERIEQCYCTVNRWDKYRLLRAVLDEEKPTLAIIFTNMKRDAHKLAKRLTGEGTEAREIHGDLVQAKREKVMERFRKHQIPVLVATDLASRGIDVSAITHIINFDLPRDPEVYVHRIGRTARMGAFGKAISFVTPEEGHELTQIEMLINNQIKASTYNAFKPTDPPDGHQPDAGRGPGRGRGAGGRGQRGGRGGPPADTGGGQSQGQSATSTATDQPAEAEPTLERTLGGRFPVRRRGGRRRR
jgi:ATP-dependent RNA helicase DeaD